MNSNMEILTAKWQNVIHLNYTVDDEHLLKLLPKSTILDKYQHKAWVSIVALDFRETNVKGVPVPGYTDFPQINFRFYVTNGLNKKGVVFIKEYIPGFLMSFAANMFFNENYRTIDMKSKNEKKYDNLLFRHDFTVKDINYYIEAVTGNESFTPISQSFEHFFKQRDSGFGVDKNGRTFYFDVEHERWRIYESKELKLDLDFGKIFGNEWEFLNDKKEPDNWFVADGSSVKMYNMITVTD